MIANASLDVIEEMVVNNSGMYGHATVRVPVLTLRQVPQGDRQIQRVDRLGVCNCGQYVASSLSKRLY